MLVMATYFLGVAVGVILYLSSRKKSAEWSATLSAQLGYLRKAAVIVIYFEPSHSCVLGPQQDRVCPGGQITQAGPEAPQMRKERGA